MPAVLHSTRRGDTLVLSLSDPERRNALGMELCAAGIEALNVAESSAEVRSVVLTGADGVFCGGHDPRQLQASRRQGAAHQAGLTESLHSWIEAVHSFPKPVIAAVEGLAADAGFALALVCDFIVAGREARFAMSAARLGLTPDAGASWSLAQALPRQLASELLMLGSALDAQRLHALGVVNRVCASGTALVQALQLAEQLNARAGSALTATKDLLAQAPDSALAAQLARERDLFVRQLHHADTGPALAAWPGLPPPGDAA